jgi:hypothetical protein
MASVFAAAGVAAALAASLTALVVPTDAAHAASPTSNVIVVNPATEPALTRNVDDPGRIAYQSTATCVLDSTACTFNFPAVPKNHRLVVQHLSGTLLFAAGVDGRGAQVFLNGGANAARSHFYRSPLISG